MLLNLKALNESFEKKYDLKENETKQSLNESAKLNEKFSDSMPSWLKKRLGYTIGWDKAQTSSGGWRHRKSQMDKMNNKYPNASVPSARKQRGGSSHESTYALGPQFLAAGIDLNKVDVIEAPIPSKVPRATKNQQFIPIFAFANGQVWAKGINDREEAHYNAIPGYNTVPFGSIPGLEIVNNAVAYAYIDLSAKGATDKIQKQRADLKAALAAIPEISREMPGSASYAKNTYVDKDSKGRTIGDWVQRDKSGYLKLNASRYKKIADKLAKNKKYKKLPYLIDECSEKLDYYKQQLTMTLEDVDVADYESAYDILNAIHYAVEDLNNASGAFQELKEFLDQIDDVSNISEEDEWNAGRALAAAQNCYNKLASMEARLGHLFKEVADW